MTNSVCVGTIVKGIGGFYYVNTPNGQIECRARGKFRQKKLTPMVGDSAAVELVGNQTGSLVKIYPRKNYLIRPAVANIDAVAAVCAISVPKPDLLLTDKLLISAKSKGIEAFVCLNKCENASAEEINALKEIYEKAHYRVVCTSAKTQAGIEELEKITQGKTVAFAGQSGVGKSSLISRLANVDLETGAVGKTERGRHTTRSVELHSTGKGYVFDTPGFSRLETDALRAQDLWKYFPEIEKHHGSCRFRTCNHVGEPGCTVAQALENGEIAQSRYDNYVELFNKLKNINEWERTGCDD